MRWWVIAFVVAGLLWWLAHRHLNRRVAKLAARGAARAGCGCAAPNAAPSLGTVGTSISSSVGNGASQTSGGLQIAPAAVGTLPTSVGNGGPNALPKWDPNGGLWS